MTLAQAAPATGSSDNVVTAAPFRAGDIATIDPRWNLRATTSCGCCARSHRALLRKATRLVPDCLTFRLCHLDSYFFFFFFFF